MKRIGIIGLLNTKINIYPNFKDEIIMSTIVKDEDNIIVQWIEYHKLLGINRFIIYDNHNCPDGNRIGPTRLINKN